MHCNGMRVRAVCNAGYSSRGFFRRAGLTTTVQPQEQESNNPRTGQMEHDTSRATERSEGGSRSRRPTRRAILTEQIVVRVSKSQLIDLEDYAFANELNVAQVARRAIHQYLNAPTPAENATRERFEESP